MPADQHARREFSLSPSDVVDVVKMAQARAGGTVTTEDPLVMVWVRLHVLSCAQVALEVVAAIEAELAQLANVGLRCVVERAIRGMELAAGGLEALGRAQRKNLEQKVRGAKRLRPDHPRLLGLQEKRHALADEHGGQRKLAQAAEHVDERLVGHADPTYGPEGVLTATAMALRKLVHVLDLLEEEVGSERSAA